MFIVDPFIDSPATNNERINQMKKVMNGILEYALTERQRQVFEMYYCERMNLTEIGDILGIHKSSVYRALEAARNKVKQKSEKLK